MPCGCCAGLSGSPGAVSPSTSVFSECASTGTRLANSHRMRATIAAAVAAETVKPRDLKSMAAGNSSEELRACFLGDGVEQPVGEAALALVVEGVGDIDVFRDHRPNRHILAREQFVGPGAEDRAHRPVEPFERPA